MGFWFPMASCSHGIASCSWLPGTFVWTPQPWQTWREKSRSKPYAFPASGCFYLYLHPFNWSAFCVWDQNARRIQKGCISVSRLQYTACLVLFLHLGKFAVQHGLRSLMSAWFRTSASSCPKDGHIGAALLHRPGCWSQRQHRPELVQL